MSPCQLAPPPPSPEAAFRPCIQEQELLFAGITNILDPDMIVASTTSEPTCLMANSFRDDSERLGVDCQAVETKVT